ncbi:uncharacterized protein LOC119647779 [Hermetia illucens]|uniref:uncharacterized protein LOC119647779 n=1 Tax=Hermetia illucens TaxID=343691 RepID=UPI0018CC0F9D|nr:uncharacterized protein LOC119647779 [Hermetia illucens]
MEIAFHSILGFLFALFYILDAKREFNIYQRVCLVKSLHQCCQVNCTIVNQTNSVPYMNFHFTMTEDLLNIYGKVIITVKRSNKKPFNLLNMNKMGVCQLADGTFGLLLAKRFITELQKHGNFPSNCPVKKDHYYIERLVINPDILPEYIHNISYQSRGTFYTIKDDGKTQNLFSIQYDGEIVRKVGVPVKRRRN